MVESDDYYLCYLCLLGTSYYTSIANLKKQGSVFSILLYSWAIGQNIFLVTILHTCLIFKRGHRLMELAFFSFFDKGKDAKHNYINSLILWPRSVITCRVLDEWLTYCLVVCTETDEMLLEATTTALRAVIQKLSCARSQKVCILEERVQLIHALAIKIPQFYFL